jgi:hypothetical protein
VRCAVRSGRIWTRCGAVRLRRDSVCDAYDTMVSDRHYSSALEAQAALAELRRSAGRQFDPRVVEAFVAAYGRHIGAGAGRFLPWSA